MDTHEGSITGLVALATAAVATLATVRRSASGFGEFATATVAIFATVPADSVCCVAGIAGIAVAKSLSARLRISLERVVMASPAPG